MTAWRRASACNDGNCVEVTKAGAGLVAVRNSHDGDRMALYVTRSEIAAFIAGVKAGEFDDLTAG